MEITALRTDTAPQEMEFNTTRGLVIGQSLFGRYRLEKILGRGGMGVVWLARDERLNRQIALKVLPDEFFYDPDAREDLKHETRKSLELTHQNIVRIHDFVEDEKAAGISMEYVDGATLSQIRLQQTSKILDADVLEPWIAKVCEALHYAHSTVRLVHRDLKPANIMVNSRNQIKITDFGIACSLRNSLSRVSIRRVSSGTVVYMSPQQMMGESVSPSDDIYALGATIYEVMTSKPPFYTGDISLQVCNKQSVSMSQRRLELGLTGRPIPKHWERTVELCLSKEEGNRPTSTLEVARMLGLVKDDPHVVVPVPAKAFPINKAGALPAVLKGLFSTTRGLVLVAVTAFLVGWAIYALPVMLSTKELSSSSTDAAPVPVVRENSPTNGTGLRKENSQPLITKPLATPAANLLPIAADKEFLSNLKADGRLEIITIPAGLPYKIYSGALVGRTDLTPDSVKPIREGITPVKLENLQEGMVTVICSRPGWEDHVSEVQVDRDSRTIEASFPGGTLAVTSSPPLAEVTIDETVVGNTPLTTELSLGDHKITARLPSGAEQTESVTITEGNQTDLTLKLGSANHKHHRISELKPPQSGWQKLQNTLKKIFSPSSKKQKPNNKK